MRFLDHRETLPESLRGAIVALGNFDGFHLGHQATGGFADATERGYCFHGSGLLSLPFSQASPK